MSERVCGSDGSRTTPWRWVEFDWNSERTNNTLRVNVGSVEYATQDDALRDGLCNGWGKTARNTAKGGGFVDVDTYKCRVHRKFMLVQEDTIVGAINRVLGHLISYGVDSDSPSHYYLDNSLSDDDQNGCCTMD